MAPFNFDQLIFNGEEITDTQTVVELKIQYFAEVVALKLPGGSNHKAMMWRRFATKNIKLTSYWSMATGTKWETLKFKAKRAVRIHGHGVFGPITTKR